MIKTLFALAEIAKQLKRIADLYEAEMAARVIAPGSRSDPIRLYTETPGDEDTQVYAAGEMERPDWFKRLWGQEPPEDSE